LRRGQHTPVGHRRLNLVSVSTERRSSRTQLIRLETEHAYPPNSCFTHLEEALSAMSQPPVDAKAFYGYLFQDNKKPTEVLDALLRGIAIYIVSVRADCLSSATVCDERLIIGRAIL
jgi:hypothetical protein